MTCTACASSSATSTSFRSPDRASATFPPVRAPPTISGAGAGGSTTGGCPCQTETSSPLRAGDLQPPTAATARTVIAANQPRPARIVRTSEWGLGGAGREATRSPQTRIEEILDGRDAETFDGV